VKANQPKAESKLQGRATAERCRKVKQSNPQEEVESKVPNQLCIEHSNFKITILQAGTNMHFEHSGNIHFPQMQLSWCFAGCLS
jgi:hypothetical protein